MKLHLRDYTRFLLNLSKVKYSNYLTPYKLIFAITYNCNSRCKMCNIWKKHPINELSLDEIKQIAKSYRKFKWLDITGGEPFLRDDFVDIVKSFKKYNDVVLFNTTTNGYLTDIIVERMDRIAQLKIPKTVITVSLDGTPKIHDYLRGINGAWKMAVKTYMHLKGLSKKYDNLSVYFGFTLSKYNVGQYEKMYYELKKLFPDIEYSDIHVNIYHSSSHYYGNRKISMNDNIIKNEINKIIKLRGIQLNPISIIDNLYLSKAIEYVEFSKTPMKCNAIRTSVFVDSIGNVYPCTIYSKKLGNLRKNNYDINKIINSPESLKVAKDIENGRCPGCWTPCEAYHMILSKFAL